MNLDQKLGQLFILPAVPAFGPKHFAKLEELVKKYPVGGFLMKQGSAQAHRDLVKLLKSSMANEVAPFFIRDAENGSRGQIEGCIDVPLATVLGTLCSEEIASFSKKIADDLASFEIQINLAPVLDLKGSCSWIAPRCFDSDPLKVASAARTYILAAKKVGVASCLKHFPGHGFASGNSHDFLPVVNTHVDEALLPYKELIAKNVPIDFIMVGHLLVPAIDEQLPSSLSKKTITSLLKEELGFNGLVMTDALNMDALRKNYTPEKIGMLAYSAGNHLLLYGHHLELEVNEILNNTFPRVFKRLKLAFEVGDLSTEELDSRVLEILRKKQSLNIF